MKCYLTIRLDAQNLHEGTASALQISEEPEVLCTKTVTKKVCRNYLLIVK
jgi:hypothetical protein